MVEKKQKPHYAYAIVVGLCLLMVPSAFLSNTASIFYSPVSKELGVGLTQYSLCSSIQLWVIAISVGFLGKVLAKVDARITLTSAIILQALAYFLNSRATSLTMFYIDAVLLGLCHCVFIYLVTPVFINNWFSVRVGTMIGIAGASQGLGAVIFNTVGAAIIQNYGWRACFVCWTLVTLVIGVPVSLFVMRLKPEEKGLKPYGYEQVTAQAASSSKEIVRGMSAKAARKKAIFWIACSASMAIGAADCFNYYLNAYCLDIGISAVVAGAAASMVMVGNMLGKIITGAIQDKNAKAGAIFGAGCPTLGFLLILLLAKQFVWIIWIGFFLFGVGYGATNVISPDLVRRAFGKRDYANMWSTFAATQTVACALGTTFWGLIVDNLGYSAGMLVVSCFTLWTLIASLMTYSKAPKLEQEWTE